MKKSLILLVLLFVGCNQNSEDKDRAIVEKQQSHYAIAQPVPFFDHSTERDAVIQLYKMRNERIRTWTVWRSDMGMIEGHCESIGFPIPYDVQLTNPLRPAKVNGSGEPISSAIIEQAEPNGLFSSKHTTATWIRSVVTHNGRTIETPLYVEGKVTCYPYPIMVDYEKNRVTPANSDAPPTVVLESGKK